MAERVRAGQAEDPYIQAMLQYLRDGELPEDAQLARRLRRDRPNHVVRDGYLYFKSQDRGRDAVEVIVVPSALCHVALGYAHDRVGHPGLDETLAYLRKRCHWARMKDAARRYVASCEVCARVKADTQAARARQRPRKPRGAWETIAVDLMGPYPRTRRGNTTLLVVTDLFTRWVEAFPLAEATSENIIRKLEEEVFHRFGYPCFILSDNDKRFIGVEMQEAAARWGAEMWTTPIYKPRGNPTERRNQEVKKGLRIALLHLSHTK